MTAPTIRTHGWAKPIPDRQFDWAAYYDGHEEGDTGYGPTEEAARQDLIENYDPPGWRDEDDIPVNIYGETDEDR